MKRNGRSNRKRKRTVNTNLPTGLITDLEKFCEETGQTKTQVLNNALNQFLAIKGEEKSFRELHPERRIKTQVLVEAVAREEEPTRMASVLIY